MGNEALIERALQMASNTEDVRADTLRELVAALKAAEAELLDEMKSKQTFYELWQRDKADLAAARSENDRLQKLVRSAYNEAFIEGGQENTSRGGKPWQESRACALLAGKATT